MGVLKLLIVLPLVISSINCQNLRDLKLERDNEKYKILEEVANNTVYQLYNKTVSFYNRYDAYIEQTDVMIIKVVIDEYSDFPQYKNQTTFQIINGRPELPDLNIPKEVEFNVYGAKDLQEEFKAFANMIAAGYSGYEYGNVTIYRKETEFTAQTRFKCFVKSKDGKDYGAFEIIQEDLNDRDDIKSKIKVFFSKVKNIIGEITPGMIVVTELIATVKSIQKDIFPIIFSASSFLRISYALLLFILI